MVSSLGRPQKSHDIANNNKKSQNRLSPAMECNDGGFTQGMGSKHWWSFYQPCVQALGTLRDRTVWQEGMGEQGEQAKVYETWSMRKG